MQARRQEVMHVAKQLFLEKGFAETSVQDILQKANISKGTFYNYFASKNDCLIAILKQAQREATVERERILLEAGNDSKEVLAKQIIVRMEWNRKYHLIPLLSFIFQAQDEDLRTFAKEQHITELAWLSQRFIDLYGETVKPVALDCAVIFFGMMQQYHTVWQMYAKEAINRQQLIDYLLRRIEAVMADLSANNESFVSDELLQEVNKQMQEAKCAKDELLEQLTVAEKEWSDDAKVQEFLGIFQDEIRQEQPRKLLLETMLQAFYRHLELKGEKVKARALTERLFAFISSLEKPHN